MVLALALALFVFVVGPTVFILNLVPTAIGSYFQDLAMMSARTGAEGGDAMTDWLSGWTIFYWAWWVSLDAVRRHVHRPHLARPHHPPVRHRRAAGARAWVSLVWFAIFGGAAHRPAAATAPTSPAPAPPRRSCSSMLAQHAAGRPSPRVLVMVLVAIFFVSGADAASIVMGTLSERGTIGPSRKTVIFWGVATGAVAAVMLLVGGADALSGLQTITIVAALPFVLVMVGLAVALVKDLRSDPLMVRRAYAAAAVEQAVVAGVTEHGDDFTPDVRGVRSRRGCRRPRDDHPVDGSARRGSRAALERAGSATS